MQLNTDKSQHMVVNQKDETTEVTLDNQKLEQVSLYKYLGVMLNNTLDYDQQWEKVTKSTNCHIHLIKQRKHIGFQEEVLINVYRSITHSQYMYSAPLLTSTSKTAQQEMERQQQSFLKIIGISQERAQKEYSIEPINMYIEKQYVNVLDRILKDPELPITQKLQLKATAMKTRNNVHYMSLYSRTKGQKQRNTKRAAYRKRSE